MNQIKQFFRCSLLVALFSLILSGISFAQTYVDVAPGFSTLNDAITANASTPNVIFRLQRGAAAIYKLNGSITVNSAMRIEAVDGTGARPQLIPAIGSGGVSDIPFRIKSNLTLKGVYVTSKDEQGAFLSQILRVQADGIRLKLDDCFLENSAQSAIRTDNKNSKIYITNSTIRCCASDYANGRGIDDRGVDMDTLYVLNNTIYNIGSRFLRDGGGVLNYAYFNHNTFTNIGNSILQLGECPTVIFTNNLLLNCGFLGQGKSSTAALIQLNALASSVYAGRTQSVTVSNNNYYLDNAFSSKYPDTAKAVPRYDANMLAKVIDAGLEYLNLSESITFTTPPPSTANLVSLYWADPLLNSSTTATQLRITGDYNFAYPTSAQSYTKGSDGKPVGATTWFNIVIANEKNNLLPHEYSLQQNYPNPFNPATTINYTLPASGQIRLDVYNSLGQLITTLVNENQAAGRHQAVWNGKNQSGNNVASGVYFYTLKAGSVNISKKMMLLK